MAAGEAGAVVAGEAAARVEVVALALRVPVTEAMEAAVAGMEAGTEAGMEAEVVALALRVPVTAPQQVAVATVTEPGHRAFHR